MRDIKLPQMQLEVSLVPCPHHRILKLLRTIVEKVIIRVNHTTASSCGFSIFVLKYFEKQFSNLHAVNNFKSDLLTYDCIL